MSGPPKPDTRLLWFLLQHAATGALVAVGVVYAIMKLDLFGLGVLIDTSRHGFLALGLLLFGLGVTFASVAMGTAIFLLPKDRDRWW